MMAAKLSLLLSLVSAPIAIHGLEFSYEGMLEAQFMDVEEELQKSVQYQNDVVNWVKVRILILITIKKNIIIIGTGSDFPNQFLPSRIRKTIGTDGQCPRTRIL